MSEWRHGRRRRTRLALGGAAVLLALVLIGSLTAPAEQSDAGREEPRDAAAPASVRKQAASTQRSKKGATARATRSVAVARVIDGDTLELASGVVVRLVQIDAPEVSSSECYAAKAAATLRRLLPPGRAVTVVADPDLDRRDRYGRRLAYVFKGGELIQATLVALGAASPWFFDGARGRYAARLLARAREAKSAGRGLWGACPGTRLDPLRAVATVRPVPAPTPAHQPEPAPEPGPACHASYEGECLDASVSDYDCAGGSGDGPGYVAGPVRVVGPDEYGLDGDGDGDGCE